MRKKMTKSQFSKQHPPMNKALYRLLIKDKLNSLPEMGAENNFKRAMYIRELRG